MTPDIQFLINCCKTTPSADDIEFIRSTIANSDQQQLTTIIAFAHYHAVFPSVNQALQTYTADLLTVETQAELKNASLRITMHNMRMTGEMIRITRLLKEKGVDALHFKGPVLAKIAYGDINLRQYGDLDIFIKRTGFRDFAPLMTEMGYQAQFPIEKYIYDKVMFDLNNDCPYYHPEKALAVEFHWDFFRKLGIPTDKFKPWDNNETVAINQFELPTLSHETHLLYHSLHGSKHVWERLVWILDMDRFIRAVPDINWDTILNKSKNMGTQRMFLFGVALAIKYYNTPVPQKINQLCTEAKFESLIDFVASEFKQETPTPEDSVSKLVKVISLRDNLYFKTATILEFMFRPGINERRTIILPDKLFWLYWLIRPFGMAFRFVFCRLLHLCDKETSK